MTMTAEELLLGGEATHVVELDAGVLVPGGGGAAFDGASVVIRPLLLADVQRIQRAARDEGVLTSVLMVQHALVEPKLTLEQVTRMHAGLVEHLLREINRVSGLGMAADELDDVVRAPLSRACFVLAREFGWTPDECAALTLGQVLVYLEMLGRGTASWSDGEPS